MKNVLITGANSYIGTNVEKWLNQEPNVFKVHTVSTLNSEWRKEDFSKYDVVFHVAGIAHVDANKKKEPLYRSVNTGLTIEVAKHAKKHGVKQFIFMSSMIVYQESKSLNKYIITPETVPSPNGFYGDSKLQAEIGLRGLQSDCFNIVILRPPMIYGPESKGNFIRLKNLAEKIPVFPDFHNQRSMLYIDNLCECVKQLILHESKGTFFPQNRELADTVTIVKSFAELAKHKILVTKLLNPFVRLAAPFIVAIPKMFASYYYSPEMSKMDFEYQIVSQRDSFLAISGARKTE